MKRFVLASSIVLALVAFSSCFETNQPGSGSSLLKSPTLPSTSFNYTEMDIPEEVFAEGFINNVGGVSFENIDFTEDAFIDNFGSPGSSPIFDPVFNSNDFVPRMSVSDNGATLGRVLFYDTRLSLNNSVSCGSCHFQEKSFADLKALSSGFEGRETTRNSMAIVNAGLQNNLFWDSRVQSTHALILEPVQNHIEMGIEDPEILVGKLGDTEFYPELFKNAFGTTEVTTERISDAMSQFLNSMVSFNSKFDQERANNFAGFTPLEKAGMELFNSTTLQCNGCHAGLTFSAPDNPNNPNDEYGGFSDGGGEVRGTANIGLEKIYTDNGRFDGKFKIPTLRNIALTAPYMHDGRFETLAEVIDHYDHQIKPHDELDDKFLVNGSPQNLNLNDAEKLALIAFLQTLTDFDFIADQKFSDPFQ